MSFTRSLAEALRSARSLKARLSSEGMKVRLLWPGILVVILAVILASFFENRWGTSHESATAVSRPEQTGSAHKLVEMPTDSEAKTVQAEHRVASEQVAGDPDERKSATRERLPENSTEHDKIADSPTLVVEESPPRELPPQGGGPLSISGIVLDEGGSGIPEIEVIATWKNLFVARGEANAPRSERQSGAVTGFDGYYEIRGLEDGEYQIRTRANDRYEAVQSIVRAGAQTADLVLREKRPSVRIFGTVESNGEPLNGVKVYAIGQSSQAAQTGSEGFYEIALEMTGGRTSYTLRFAREGYREERTQLQSGEISENGELRVDMELEANAALTELSGTLRSADGPPVPGENLQLYSKTTWKRYSTVSDDNGSFWFPEVETGSDYTLSVHPVGPFRDFSLRDLDIGQSGADLDVVLEPVDLGSLSGQMVDVHGNPLPELSLWLRNTNALNQPGWLVTSDRKGYFSVDGIESGSLVFASHSAPYLEVKGIHLSRGEERQVKLVLDWGDHQVAGRVLDDLGQPVPASELFVSSVRHDGGLQSYASRQGITDGEGNFLFTQVGAGYHTVRIDAPGFRAKILDLDVGADDSSVTIRLERKAGLGDGTEVL